ncbi:MAG: hypothetical protein R3C01_17690 [Planctomycetaceae bacterium]
MNAIRRFLFSEEATTAVEYAVLLALLILTMVFGIKALSNSSTGLWSGNMDKLDAHGF